MRCNSCIMPLDGIMPLSSRSEQVLQTENCPMWLSFTNALKPHDKYTGFTGDGTDVTRPLRLQAIAETHAPDNQQTSVLRAARHRRLS